MTTYIQGYLNSRVPDDRTNPYDDIFGDGRQITNLLAPQVVFSGVVGGNVYYTEVERLAAYAETSGDNANGQVSAKAVQMGDEISFTPAISASNGVGAQVYFLGNYWMISAMNGFTSSGCPLSTCSVVLSRGSTVLTLVNGASLPGASSWIVSLVSEGGAALKKIAVSDVNSVPSLAVGQSMNIAGATGGSLNSHKLVFNGVDSVPRDLLLFSPLINYFLPTSTDDTSTRSSVVLIASNSPNPFGNSLGVSTPINQLYFVIGNAYGSATVGDIFYYYNGVYRRFVHPQGGGGINFVDYQYSPTENVRLSFNANNIQQTAPPDYSNFVIAIPEYVTEPNSPTEQGGWFIDVGYANSMPILFRNNDVLVGYSPDSHSVAQPHSNVALYDSGFVSDRGGIMRASPSYASLSYALSLARAKYSLVKLAGPLPSSSPLPSLSPSPSPTMASCTDGGLNYFVHGQVYGRRRGSGPYYEPYNYPDYCLDTTRLIEHYCNGTRSSYVSYSCSLGCVNGVCPAPAPPQLEDWTVIALVLVLFVSIVSTGYFWRARNMKK